MIIKYKYLLVSAVLAFVLTGCNRSSEEYAQQINKPKTVQKQSSEENTVTDIFEEHDEISDEVTTEISKECPLIGWWKAIQLDKDGNENKSDKNRFVMQFNEDGQCSITYEDPRRYTYSDGAVYLYYEEGSIIEYYKYTVTPEKYGYLICPTAFSYNGKEFEVEDFNTALRTMLPEEIEAEGYPQLPRQERPSYRLVKYDGPCESAEEEYKLSRRIIELKILNGYAKKIYNYVCDYIIIDDYGLSEELLDSACGGHTADNTNDEFSGGLSEILSNSSYPEKIVCYVGKYISTDGSYQPFVQTKTEKGDVIGQYPNPVPADWDIEKNMSEITYGEYRIAE